MKVIANCIGCGKYAKLKKGRCKRCIKELETQENRPIAVAKLKGDEE